MAKIALMPKSNLIASTNMVFAISDISVIIADEYGHNDCDGDIGFLEIDDLNGFNCCNS